MSDRPKIPCKNAILLRREQQQECRRIERNHIQELVTDTYLAIEQRDEAWDEIERLRETIETVEHEVALVYDHLTGGKLSKANTAAQHVIDAAEEGWKTWTDELIAEAVKEKDAEIERLEEDVRKEWLIGYAEIKDEDAGIFHIITRDQIRAAWDERHDGVVEGIMFIPASEIGITDCGRCHGWGVVPINEESPRDTGKCPTCHGEGWVIEEGK